MEIDSHSCECCTFEFTGEESKCPMCGFIFWTCSRCGEDNSSTIGETLGIQPGKMKHLLDASICLHCDKVAHASDDAWGCNRCFAVNTSLKKCSLCSNGNHTLEKYEVKIECLR